MKIQSVSQQNFKAGGMLYKKKDHTLKYKLVSFGPDGEVSNSLQFSVDIVNNASDASISGFPVVASALRDASGTYYTSAQDLFEDLEIVITDTSIVNIVGPIGPVGPAGLAWKGVWDVATAYIVNDAVSFGGASYFCIVNVTGGGNPPANATNWALLASQGAQGPAGSNASPQTFQEVLTIGNTSTLPAVFQSATATTIVESGNVGAATSQKRVNLNGTDGVVYEKDLTGSPKRLVLDAVNALTANRTQFLQDKDGTIALLSDVPSTTGTYTSYVAQIIPESVSVVTTNVLENTLGTTVTVSWVSGKINIVLGSQLITLTNPYLSSSNYFQNGIYHVTTPSLLGFDTIELASFKVSGTPSEGWSFGQRINFELRIYN